MGCNAWNHPPGCDCGWGGAYYESNGTTYQNHWNTLGSYTTPNAKCPICGAKVFFYKSPLGGSVYFDDLGPPWPKHACTSTESHKLNTAKNHQQITLSHTQEIGWIPLIFSDVKQHGNLHIEIRAENNNSIPPTLFTKTKRVALSKNCPYFIRKSSIQDGFEISTLDIEAREPHEIKLIAAESIKKLDLILENEQKGGGIRQFETKPPKGKSINPYKPLHALRDMNEYPGEIRVKAFNVAKNEFLTTYDKKTPTLLEALLSDDLTIRSKYLTKELLTKYWFNNNYQHIIRVLYEVMPDAGKIIDECAATPSPAIKINQLIIRNMEDFRKEKARKSDIYKMLEMAYCCRGETDEATVTFHKFIDAIRMHENRIREIADELVSIK